MDSTQFMRDLQRKGTEDVGSAHKSSDYIIASIVVDLEISERALSAFQRDKAGEEDVAERYEALV